MLPGATTPAALPLRPVAAPAVRGGGDHRIGGRALRQYGDAGEILAFAALEPGHALAIGVMFPVAVLVGIVQVRGASTGICPVGL